MPIKIEGILTDEMYKFLNEGINTREFYKENNVKFVRVDEFSKDADIRIISAEKLLERGTAEGILDGTILVENSDIDDKLEIVPLGDNLLPTGKFHWLPEIFIELPDYVLRRLP